MAEPTIAELTQEAAHAVGERQFERALRLYTCVLCAQPQHLDARLRIGDCLLGLGEVQRAAAVYTALARHAAQSGYPLRAMVAIKVLAALDPAMSPLVGALAELYAAESGRVGRGARPVPPPEQPLSAEARAVLGLEGEPLIARAEAQGQDLSACGASYPQVLPPIPLLSQLSRDDFVSVLSTVTLVRRQAGESVITQGDDGTSFFLVARGEFEVHREERDAPRTVLATLSEGALFGEMALVARSPRTAHVTAQTSGDVLEFQIDALERLRGGAAAIARALDRFTRERLVMNLMATAPLFRPLAHEQRVDLVRRFRAHEVAALTDLIREGEQVPGLYLVLDGAVDVWKLDGAEKVLLATLRPGDVFGEMSLLNDAPASATVTAAQRSTVLVLAREYFDRLVESLPVLREYLESLGEERALDTNMWLDTGAVSTTGEPVEIDVDLGEL